MIQQVCATVKRLINERRVRSSSLTCWTISRARPWPVERNEQTVSGTSGVDPDEVRWTCRPMPLHRVRRHRDDHKTGRYAVSFAKLSSIGVRSGRFGALDTLLDTGHVDGRARLVPLLGTKIVHSADMFGLSDGVRHCRCSKKAPFTTQSNDHPAARRPQRHRRARPTSLRPRLAGAFCRRTQGVVCHRVIQLSPNLVVNKMG